VLAVISSFYMVLPPVSRTNDFQYFVPVVPFVVRLITSLAGQRRRA
jgi:hypothetical protein